MRYAILSLLVLMWLATLMIAVAWVLGWDLGFEAEPATVLLGTASTGLTAAVAYFGVKLEAARRELEEERFSTPMALAHGYVHNFLDPALTHLLRRTGPGEPPPRLYIFIPERLEELAPASRERILARIRAARYRDTAMNLEFSEGRARDIITITRESGGSPVYFDFPTTLLTLHALVDYKVESKAEQLSEKEKVALGAAYIAHFRAYLLQRAEALGLREYLELTDRRLAFLEAPEGPPPEAPAQG
jgi:hypothetical protein